MKHMNPLTYVGEVNGWKVVRDNLFDFYYYEKYSNRHILSPTPHPDDAEFYTRPNHVPPEDYEQIRVLCLAHHNLIS